MSQINSKKRFKRRSPGNEDMVLQITSMADIFTIILVFLLKSFSTGVTSVSPSSGLTLPEAAQSEEITESLKLELSEGALTLDDKPVVTLKGFKFDPSELEADGTPRTLNQAFYQEKEKHKQPEGEQTGKILLLADHQAPYSTVKSVLNAAANNGYMDLKLVVVGDK